ncbi:hypothetical protein ACFVRB_21540 [Streptomyces nojiriensis]|uniref:hypothetical protein n=1 Tax=Streptomyces nojiriensis TaxID=66374 RepID=UPI0036DA7A83
MRVKCIETNDPETGEPFPDPSRLRLGNVYTVLEMITGPDYWMIRILDEEGDDPGSLWYPPMFETVDARIPRDWTLVLEGGNMRLAPALWQRPNFWNDYFNNVPQALMDFETGKHEALSSS